MIITYLDASPEANTKTGSCMDLCVGPKQTAATVGRASVVEAGSSTAVVR